MAKPKPKPSLAQRVRNDPALLERALKDPGLRSKLPDKYLSSTQLTSRKDQQFRRNLGDISQPLTGDTMTRVAEGMVDREYRPQLQEIDQQEQRVQGQRDAQQGWARDYYKNIAGLFGSTQAGQTASNQQAVQAAQAQRTQALGTIDTANQQAQARGSQDAATRGAGLDGGAMEDLAAKAAQAKMRAGAQGDLGVAGADQAGRAQSAVLAGIGAATQQRGGETQGQISTVASNRLGDLGTERKRLRTDREGELTDTLMKMRGGEVERLLTEKGISSEEKQAEIDAELKMAEIQSKDELDRAKRRHEVRLAQLGFSHDDAKAEADRLFKARENELNRENAVTVAGTPRPSTSSGPASFTPDQLRSGAKKRNDALALAKTMKTGGPGLPPANRSQALAALTKKHGSDLARVAVGAIFDGGVKPHLQKLLKELYGVEVPREYLRR